MTLFAGRSAALQPLGKQPTAATQKYAPCTHTHEKRAHACKVRIKCV